jgi:di/tricarboxylate transporter
VAAVVVKVVEPVIQQDTLVPLVAVAAAAVEMLLVLEIESFQGQQTTMMETVLLYRIKDSLVELVELPAVSITLLVAVVLVVLDMLEIQTHSVMEVLVDQVKRIHLLLPLLFHQKYPHQLEQDLTRM